MKREDKNAFAKIACEHIPKILTQLDQNCHRETYGCFDRAYWQYKIKDFPSSMSQECVYPLALAYSLDLPFNPYFGKERIKELCLASIRYASKITHRDGSSDDYFPYEKAAGAKAFSLYAQVEAYKLLGYKDAELEKYFLLSALWLAKHYESGQLSNHQAIMALCLYLVARLQGGNEALERAGDSRLEIVLSWQKEEGWFPEYEGCDLGYLTFSVSFLSQIYSLKPTPKLSQAIEKAVRFLILFMHPDGSFGGEYGSRNTYNFFPDGFERSNLPEGFSINDAYLRGIANGKRPSYEDDYILGHHLWSYFLAFKNFKESEYSFTESKPAYRYFPQSGFVIWREKDVSLFCNVRKGGVFHSFEKEHSTSIDTQISLLTKDGKNFVGHMLGAHKISVGENHMVIEGNLGVANHKTMSTISLVGFRIFMMFLGRFYPDLIRKILQKILITGKTQSSYQFRREFKREDGQIKVVDQVKGRDWDKVADMKISQAQASIHVVMSQVHQINRLKSWVDLNAFKPKHTEQSFHFERTL